MRSLNERVDHNNLTHSISLAKHEEQIGVLDDKHEATVKRIDLYEGKVWRIVVISLVTLIGGLGGSSLVPTFLKNWLSR
jgi:hypothetical protein